MQNLNLSSGINASHSFQINTIDNIYKTLLSSDKQEYQNLWSNYNDLTSIKLAYTRDFNNAQTNINTLTTTLCTNALYVSAQNTINNNNVQLQRLNQNLLSSINTLNNQFIDTRIDIAAATDNFNLSCATLTSWFSQICATKNYRNVLNSDTGTGVFHDLGKSYIKPKTYDPTSNIVSQCKYTVPELCSELTSF
jgi:hypothetical protein